MTAALRWNYTILRNSSVIKQILQEPIAASDADKQIAKF